MSLLEAFSVFRLPFGVCDFVARAPCTQFDAQNHFFCNYICFGIPTFSVESSVSLEDTVDGVWYHFKGHLPAFSVVFRSPSPSRHRPAAKRQRAYIFSYIAAYAHWFLNPIRYQRALLYSTQDLRRNLFIRKRLEKRATLGVPKHF